MSLADRFHSENTIDNFMHMDGTIVFYSFVKAAMLRQDAKKVMDFGAGRGVTFHNKDFTNASLFKVELMDLRTSGAEVWACDISEAVSEHAASHHQVQISIDGKLPFEDCFFDIIVSDVTFEHVTNPEMVAAELKRVLKPGGYICARTPNKYGYPAIVARMVPNRSHVAALQKISPERNAVDIFPTAFKMNTISGVRKLFSGCEIGFYRASSEPSYHFNNALIYRFFLLVHRLLPGFLSTSLVIFIKKPISNSRLMN